MGQRIPLFAALAAAVLAAAPSASPPAGAANTQCFDEDSTGGFGGQDVDCTFHCDSRAFLSLEVDAHDQDARVWGEVGCGGIAGACGPSLMSCRNQGGPTHNADTGGECKGHSDEFWDSGLRVVCRALGIPEPHVPTCPPLCHDPPSNPVEPIVIEGAPIVVAEIHALAGQVIGRVCENGLCVPVVPDCRIEADGVICSIG